jgi:hypothetical protein
VRVRFLLRYAILAPSSHNSQPWLFRVRNDGVDVHIDWERWLMVADADKREIHVSIGCALENLLIAAERFGYAHEVEHRADEGDGPAVVVDLTSREADPTRDPELFEQIPVRRTNRNLYDGEPVPKELMGTRR